ncbi:DUF3307 domain-containing protein [Paraferrimonas sp. SM1919]|uniref:DUF3307 domain-containing protein n=1 Tax=Paraferrimonas sp. SM1919 TaxID=2662263 RepID=UPI0013D2E59C|nr:DUF3307 domain-containing protein [Paraferrimonas sp. SM1919]
MSDFWALLIPLVIVHIVCDFYLQPDRWVEAKKLKKHRAFELYLHSLLHGFGLLLPAWLFNFDWQTTFCLIAVVAVTHYVIDLWKVSATNGDTLFYFLIDQALHILVLVIASWYLTAGLSIEALVKHDRFADGILIFLTYMLILKPTSIVIGIALNKYTKASTNVSGLVDGGQAIGYLERVLIMTFTLVGSYAAVGFVLAAKSIFRFGEVNKSNDRSMTEYVLIGSMLSVVITVVLGTLTSLVLGVKIT